MRDLPSQGQLEQVQVFLGSPEPLTEVLLDLNALFLQQGQHLPYANRRKISVMLWVGDFSGNFRSEPMGLQIAPDPDMRVEQKPHLYVLLICSPCVSCAASHSDSSPVGPTISPRITPVPTPVPRRGAVLAP